MQDTSQILVAEKITVPARRLRRGPEDGNSLWKLYTSLGTIRLKEFRDMLDTNGVKLLNFNSQTSKSFRISRMAAGRLKLYRDFFLESGVDLNDIVAAELAEAAPAPASVSQQFTTNEQHN